VDQQLSDMCTVCSSRPVGSLPSLPGHARVFRNTRTKALTTSRLRISPSFTAVLSLSQFRLSTLAASSSLVAVKLSRRDTQRLQPQPIAQVFLPRRMQLA
jgi:hypothetical protein